MITRLEIENFKAIRKVAIDLTPLTVFVGPNDSGKTTILQALHLLGESFSGRPWSSEAHSVFGLEPESYFFDRTLPIRISVELAAGAPLEGTIRYTLGFQLVDGSFKAVEERLSVGADEFLDGAGEQKRTPSKKGHWTGDVSLLREQQHLADQEPYRTLRASLRSFYAAFEPPKMVTPSEADAQLVSSGAGLAGVLDRLLTSPERDVVMEKFNKALRRLSANVHSIAMRPAQAGNAKGKELLFTLPDRTTAVPAREASTGLVLVAGYLALMYGTRHRMFLIEEPENGVHPLAILTVVDLLRELASSGRQVIATTHSPVLLDYMEPEDVQIVTRRGSEGVQVTPMFKSRFFKEGTQRPDLGELWYSVGDDAIISTAS